MKVKVKGKSFLIMLCAVVMLALCSCGGYSTNSLENQTASGGAINGDTVSGSVVSGSAVSGSAVSGSAVDGNAIGYNPVTLEISVSRENKVTIPDPAGTGDTVSVLLHSENFVNVPWDDYTDEQKELCYADLSFAGFKEEVLVTAVAVGFTVNKDSSSARILYTDKGKEKTKQGNCLALLVTEGVDKEEDYFYTITDRNYLLVIDYANHNYYKTKSKFWIDDNKLKFSDLTGDGKNELLIQAVHNKWIDFEVWRFDTKKQKVKELYSDFEKEDTDSFSGHLEDNYKVVFEYKEIGYSHSFSMLDVGYKESDLQVDKESDWDGSQFVQLWKNGVLQRDLVDKNTVFLYTLDDVSLVTGDKGVPQLRLQRDLMVGHRSQSVGTVYTFFQYDRKKNRLVLADVTFKPY